MFAKFCTVLGTASLYIACSSSFGQSTGVGSIEVSDKVISVSGQGHHRTFPCNGRKLEVMGSGHIISTSGVCSNVEISGSMNTVDVTIAPKGTLEVSGSNHTVRWKATSDIERDISGVNHKITREKM